MAEFSSALQLKRSYWFGVVFGFCCFSVLGIESGASHLQNTHSILTHKLNQIHLVFCLGFCCLFFPLSYRGWPPTCKPAASVSPVQGLHSSVQAGGRTRVGGHCRPSVTAGGLQRKEVRPHGCRRTRACSGSGPGSSKPQGRALHHLYREHHNLWTRAGGGAHDRSMRPRKSVTIGCRRGVGGTPRPSKCNARRRCQRRAGRDVTWGGRRLAAGPRPGCLRHSFRGCDWPGD